MLPNQWKRIRERQTKEGGHSDELVKKPWSSLVGHSLVVVAAISVGLAFYAFQRVQTLEERLESQLTHSSERMQSLDALVRFDSRRRTLLLGLRDRILSAGSDISHDQAYQYARLAVEAAEKYPSVDPALLVSIGVVESGYDARAKSPAGAIGLYQLIPSTARLITRTLGWEYTDDMLYDPSRNTEMAALYLEVLFGAYNDPRMVLAEYNGGPLNAGYLRAGVNRVSPETRNYVKKVLEVYEGLKVRLGAKMAVNRHGEDGAWEHASTSLLEASLGSTLGALEEADHPTAPLAGR